MSLCFQQILGFSHARSNPAEDYWNEVVKGQTMPEAIAGRIHKKQELDSITDLHDHRFSGDFDTKENPIIYHGYQKHHKEMMIMRKAFDD